MNTTSNNRRLSAPLVKPIALKRISRGSHMEMRCLHVYNFDNISSNRLKKLTEKDLFLWN